MISQPIRDKTEEEIKVTRERAIKVLKENEYKVINTLFTNDWYSEENMKKRGVVNIHLTFLAKSIETMATCHVAYFCKGWKDARECKIEHEVAKQYGLEILYEK
jgi:hypothetical protein